MGGHMAKHVRGHVWLGAFAIAALVVGVSANDAAAQGSAKGATFAKDVAPILQQHCQICHRQNGGAPFPLMTYEQTRPWARAIKQKVTAREMPPWHVDKTTGISKYKDDISLSSAQ